ncbi:MAG: hypothetical protein M3220_06345 [Chloroflexota bacterium]|nr:hypothetical protein [Chloroflexota bacterium]
MAAVCVICGQAIEAGDYRLVGVERGTWESRYAHRGNCEAEARTRFAPQPLKNPKKKKVRKSKAEVEVEELTMDEPEPFPEEELPWFGMERRR